MRILPARNKIMSHVIFLLKGNYFSITKNVFATMSPELHVKILWL